MRIMLLSVLAAVATILPAQAESGVASWYGYEHAGKKTASGQIFDPLRMTAAHATLPFGSCVVVINTKTGQAVLVTITDRGPFHDGRIIDLSLGAARRLGMESQGLAQVEIIRGDRETAGGQQADSVH